MRFTIQMKQHQLWVTLGGIYSSARLASNRISNFMNCFYGAVTKNGAKTVNREFRIVRVG